MSTSLISGHTTPLTSADHRSIEHIAEALAGAGLSVIQLNQLEEAAISNALKASGHNRTHAARKLGISVRTLQRKLKASAMYPRLAEQPADGLATD